MDKFHRRIDRTEAENIRIRDFLKKIPSSKSDNVFLTDVGIQVVFVNSPTPYPLEIAKEFCDGNDLFV